jgi:hypothetical protein
MSDLKTSLLVNRQVPEFVREEHPKFIAFLEAYYEFLENKQGNQLNDLIKKSKEFRYLTDVDESLDEFEQQFFSSYLSLIPRDLSVSKDFLIKNILPVYLSKGSESSFKLLFRLLFGKEVEVTAPKDKILRASDGKWVIENSLRVTSEIFSVHTGNGTSKDFELAQIVGQDEVKVFINNTLQSSGYYVKKELKELSFDNAPANNSQILVQYTDFDVSVLKNRKITGNTSGATAIVESASKSTVSGELYFDFFINSKTLTGSFENGEFVNTDLIDDDITIKLRLQTVSQVESITVTKSGASYNVGDPVIVRGEATRSAYAVVESIETGIIEEVDVLNGGAGFSVDNLISAVGISNVSFNAIVQTVDTSGALTQNTVIVYTDLISALENVVLSSPSFGFPANAVANINATIANTLANTIITNIGPISSINVLNSLITVTPTFEATPERVNGAITLIDLGIIGRVAIANSGNGYAVNEEIIFTNQSDDFWGRGAKAKISEVGANGQITRVTVTDGGLGYSSLYFPTVTANSANGSGATLSVYCILGDGESLQGVLPVDEDGNEVFPGEVKTIRVLDPGAGYKTVPIVDLSKSGNGLAEATANLLNSYQTFDLGGRWITSDSLLSSDDRRLQGRDYYINYSYVLSSKVEFSKYKDIFKQLIHPAGMIQYAEYRIDEKIESPVISANSVSVTNTISGRVEITNNSIYLTGTNTKFLVANTRGILTPGSNIAVDNQIRTVNAIISNTSLTVSSVFTISTNNESLVILS